MELSSFETGLEIAADAIMAQQNRAPRQATPRVAEIVAVVASHYRISQVDLLSNSRKWEYAHPRQIAMYICRKLTTCSYPQIARIFSDRDHTTVLFAFRKIERILAAGDERLAGDIDLMCRLAIATANGRIEATALSLELEPA